MARDVDLLVHEALAPQLVRVMERAALANGMQNRAKIMADILDYHASPVEAAQSAQTAGARHLLFYHVVPPLLVPGMQAAFLEGVTDAYSGDVSVGRDGTRVWLPPDVLSGSGFAQAISTESSSTGVSTVSVQRVSSRETPESWLAKNHRLPTPMITAT